MRIYDYLERARGRTYPKVFRNLIELYPKGAFEIERLEGVYTAVESYDEQIGALHYTVYLRHADLVGLRALALPGAQRLPTRRP